MQQCSQILILLRTRDCLFMERIPGLPFGSQHLPNNIQFQSEPTRVVFHPLGVHPVWFLSLPHVESLSFTLRKEHGSKQFVCDRAFQLIKVFLLPEERKREHGESGSKTKAVQTTLLPSDVIDGVPCRVHVEFRVPAAPGERHRWRLPDSRPQRIH